MSKHTIILIFLFLGNHYLNAQNSVNTHEGVKIGGIKQWIGAVSDDDSNPVLLFLHGGPGFSSRAYSKKFIRRLRKNFIVVQWDQRGSGITAAWNTSDDTLSLSLMHSDTEEVVNYLLKKFKKDKLYLVGFSWGGFLGHHYANQHPEKLHAYIAVSSLINGDESERLTLESIHQQASEENNMEAISELSKVKIPFNSWEELYYQRKWTAYFSGGPTSKRTYPKKLFEEWASKWMPLFLEASSTDYTESIKTLRCPVYFFISKKDLVANHNISSQYFENLSAEHKTIVWFTESTHEIPSQEPKKFSEEVIKVASSINR